MRFGGKYVDYIIIPKDWESIHPFEEIDPNKIGEALRYWSFIGRNGERGCYSTFDLPEFFIKLDAANRLKKYYNKFYERADFLCYPEQDIKLNCFIYDQKEVKDEIFYVEPLIIVIAWRWDGDGCLYFRLIGKGKDIEIINTDCKKDYTWEFVEKEK
jgi:hypothetical protein